MPYRRRTVRRRRTRKPSRYYRGYISRDMAVFRKRFFQPRTTNFKLTSVQNLTSDGSGFITDVIHVDPTGYFNGTGTLNDWTSCSGLYDQYRVTGIKLIFTPDLPNDTSTVTGFKPFYLAHDYDSVSAVTAASEIVQYGNMKVKNLYRPWTYYTRVPASFDLAGSGVVTKGGFKDIANPLTVGGIRTYSAGLDASTTYGVLIIKFYIKFKFRR